MDPEWNDFDPEKQTGNFFGREIPDEIEIREDLTTQKERWGGEKRNKLIDEEDEFDTMMEEKKVIDGAPEPKQIGVRDEDSEEELKEEEEAAPAEIPSGFKTIDEVHGQLTQDMRA